MKKNFLLLVFLLLLIKAFELNAGDHLLTHDEFKMRQKIETSLELQDNGPSFPIGSMVCGGLAACTPKYVKDFIDNAFAYMLTKVVERSYFREWLHYFCFSRDNKILHQYNEKYGSYVAIPKACISNWKLFALANAAVSEKEKWQPGNVSGVNYDGSDEHLKTVSANFDQAIDNDLLLQNLKKLPIKDSDDVIKLVKNVFLNFQTANPLHGTTFPLAVKAMRELGAMLSDLLDASNGIVNSGAKEALRIGLRQLKRTSAKKSPADASVLVIDDQHQFITRVSHTLNLQVSRATTFLNIANAEVDFAAVYLTEENLNKMDVVLENLSQRGMPTHVHVSSRMVGKLIRNECPKLRTIFANYRNVISASLDTAGLIYNGVTATIFRGPNERFHALEPRTDWSGGLYAGINAAGSIAGVDIIIAYMLALSLGRDRLALLHALHAENQKPIDDGFLTLVDHYQEESARLIEAFKTNTPLDVHELLAQTFKKDGSKDPRDISEKLLVDLVQSIFNAKPSSFLGRATSGGTESNRIAMQLHLDRFSQFKPNQTPKVLMTALAHLSFDRHLDDNDVEIIRVATDSHKSMDLKDLEQKIATHGADNIAAIVVSTPNYSFGFDNIQSIVPFAQKYGIPIHVDDCLGVFILQFLAKNNSFYLDLEIPKWAGIATLSADLHKHGALQKGLSVVSARRDYLNKHDLRLDTMFHPRSVTQLETALATLVALGQKGYEERAQAITELGNDLITSLKKIPQIELVGEPASSVPVFLVAFRLREPLREHTYEFAKILSKLGFSVSQLSDHTVHWVLTNAHSARKDFSSKFISDVQYAISLLKKFPHQQTSASVGAYGMAANLPRYPYGRKTADAYLKAIVALHAENFLKAKL